MTNINVTLSFLSLVLDAPSSPHKRFNSPLRGRLRSPSPLDYRPQTPPSFDLHSDTSSSVYNDTSSLPWQPMFYKRNILSVSQFNKEQVGGWGRWVWFYELFFCSFIIYLT